MDHRTTIPHSKKPLRVIVIATSALNFAVIILLSKHILILNNAQPSDAIFVCGGDDHNYYAGLQFLKTSGAQYMFVCLDQNDFDIAGQELQHDREFLRRTAGSLAGHIDICVENNNDDSLPELTTKLNHLGARSVLIVAPDPCSRADYILAGNRLPNYAWSVSATAAPWFHSSWWKRRGWA
jgi:hypothetical protein